LATLSRFFRQTSAPLCAQQLTIAERHSLSVTAMAVVPADQAPMMS
jgi:hypothetical protein